MAGGRKPKYATPDEMQVRIDAYFASLIRPLVIHSKTQGDFVLTDPETGEYVYEQFKPATITGLALALDMTRKGLLDYIGKNKEFGNTITRAKQKCEEYAESRLYDRDGSRGAEFSLKCNFKWSDIDSGAGEEVKIVDDL